MKQQNNKEEKTNNFDELPDTEELWIRIDDYTLKVFFKDNYWWECIKIDDKPEIFFKVEDDMQPIYLSHCINAYQVYCKQTPREDIDFAGRTISFCYDKDYKDNVNIQTGKEEKIKGMKDYSFPISMINIKKDKWLEIAKFFNKAS